jgi:hypothetical protein
MQNSLQKLRSINLVGVINNHDDPDEENLEIITRLGERLDDPERIMVPGDVFKVHLPGNRREYYIVFKNIRLIGEHQAYYQNYRYNSNRPKRLDYSDRGFHRDYDPNDRTSLFDLEYEIIEDFRLDYSIEPGHILEVNIGGEEGQSPIIVYYKVVRGLLNIEREDAMRAAKVREGFNAELEEEFSSQTRGGSNEGNSKDMSGGMTPEEQTMYTTQLKRLGEIIVKRIADEIQKAKFLDVFPNLGALERLTDIENRYKSLSELLRQGTVTVVLENVIKELRQLEYELQRERMDKEQSNVIDYYEIELARYLSQVNKRFPEDTLPHLRPGEGKQLPDTAGPVGGKKKTQKKRKRNKNTRKRKRNKSLSKKIRKK